MPDTPSATLPGKPRSFLSVVIRFLRLWSHPESFLQKTGQLRSFRENRPVDAAGRPLPWLPYALIHLLDDRLNDTLRVFEYGSGYSTLFFASRVATVNSVEHVAEWVSELEPYLPANASLAHAAGEAYALAPTQHAPFDLILIDGIDRMACLQQALNCLSPGGVIVLDDTHREDYAAGLEEVCKQGFKVLRWFGPKPTSLIEAQSSLIYKPKNCLQI